MTGHFSLAAVLSVRIPLASVLKIEVFNIKKEK